MSQMVVHVMYSHGALKLTNWNIITNMTKYEPKGRHHQYTLTFVAVEVAGDIDALTSHHDHFVPWKHKSTTELCFQQNPKTYKRTGCTDDMISWPTLKLCNAGLKFIYDYEHIPNRSCFATMAESRPSRWPLPSSSRTWGSRVRPVSFRPCLDLYKHGRPGRGPVCLRW